MQIMTISFTLLTRVSGTLLVSFGAWASITLYPVFASLYGKISRAAEKPSVFIRNAIFEAIL